MQAVGLQQMVAEQQSARQADPSATASEQLEQLRSWFGVEFSLLDAASERWIVQSSNQPAARSGVHLELCRAVARAGQPELIAEEEPLGLLAFPLLCESNPSLVALAPLVTREIRCQQRLQRSAEILELRHDDLSAWAGAQPVWPAEAALRLSQLLLAKSGAELRAKRSREEADKLSAHLDNTYEEISLLFRLTQNLKISSSPEELGAMTLGWLGEAVPAEGLALWLLARSEPAADGHVERTKFLTHGSAALDEARVQRLVEQCGHKAMQRPLVMNPPATTTAEWILPEYRELMLVPIVSGEHLFGWLLAVNHRDGLEFGTVEASLLSSVAAILGIHSGNIELYRQQAEFLSQVVRALTSAIDAKDPYTCGHSERVAKISVRLATEMGVDEDQIEMLYMAGLLHDVGKIGIDDNVLRKPGKLTDAEFEHIKTHAEIGYRILRDLTQMQAVLPIVRHHHESWDGKGYPSGLAGTDIPFLARIVSVADAFDAMSSDRPYRPGMPDEKLDGILRNGAGQQWDAEIVDAFFRARDDIRSIALKDRKVVDPKAEQWM